MADNDASTSVAGLVHGQVCYLQIPAVDITTSARFYERVFGWKVYPPDSGFEAPALIGQWIVDRAASATAGLLAWIIVSDIVRTLAQVAAAGGEVVDSPSPDGPRWLATFLDPAGNLVGLAQRGALRPDDASWLPARDLPASPEPT
jgi:predicted enzyme related to lactoylglutathione lyase